MITDNEFKLKGITAWVQELESPVANWSRETFEAFKAEFFKKTNVGQCIEPLFASKVGHDFFFPVYLSASHPTVPIPTHADPNTGLSLGTNHPKFVIPPCNKNCQIHALAHLYVSDLSREDQSIDLLNQWRTLQALPPATEPILSLDELKEVPLKPVVPDDPAFPDATDH
ncbi:MAG: hypothetical protein H7A38_01960 [Chlamydiales bacterium]|nr:hypothetical protein [Chlamydiales bacterium]